LEHEDGGKDRAHWAGVMMEGMEAAEGRAGLSMVSDEEILGRVAAALREQALRENGRRFRLRKLGAELVLLSCPPTPLDLRMLSSMGFRAVLNLAPADDANNEQANCEHLGLKYR
jgi:hypothetical protein